MSWKRICGNLRPRERREAASASLVGASQFDAARLAITDHSEVRPALAVERFGRSRPDRLEFVRIAVERSPRDQSREEFCQWIAALCVTQFPDETPEAFSVHADLEHSLAGNYLRRVLFHPGSYHCGKHRDAARSGAF